MEVSIDSHNIGRSISILSVAWVPYQEPRSGPGNAPGGHHPPGGPDAPGDPGTSRRRLVPPKEPDLPEEPRASWGFGIQPKDFVTFDPI